MATKLQTLNFSSNKNLDRAVWGLWVLLLVAIPITSFPLIARFTSESIVSPLSGIPLFLLVILWLVPFLLRRGKLHRSALPLIAFVIIALLASLRAPFLEIWPFKGISVISREIRAVITLGIGFNFYLVSSTLPRSSTKLPQSLRWIYLGGFLMLVWSTVQVLRLPYSFNPPPLSLTRIHHLFSIRDLFRDRVTGMAYEPSFLADQLTILYLPLWLGSVVKNYSVFNFRYKRLTVEAVMLIWGSVVLFFTYSRIGLLAFAASIGLLVFVGSTRFINRFSKSLQDRIQLPIRRIRTIAWTALVFLFIGAMLLTVFLAANTNERIYDMLTRDFVEVFESDRLPSIYNLTNRLEYAERLMYWINSFLIYSRYPFFGVGLGNAGFFFRENVPAFGTYLPEVLFILGPVEVTIANPKSLWFRLLGETGLVGFFTFMVWMVLMTAGAIKTAKKSGFTSVIGLAAGLALIAQILEGLSLDTFALPQLWIMMGFLSAVLFLDSDESKVKDSS
jgi:hypothetical protein